MPTGPVVPDPRSNSPSIPTGTCCQSHHPCTYSTYGLLSHAMQYHCVSRVHSDHKGKVHKNLRAELKK